MKQETRTIHLAPDLELPIDAVTQAFAIVGKRGRGKTNTAVVLAEELIGTGLPVWIVDTVGAWWGLRSSADGKSAGLPVVVFGGDHGDVPLEETAGALIARVLVEKRIPAVIDTSLFSKAGARRFLTAFVTEVYHRNRKPVHVIFDEADELAPQRPGADGAKLLGAMEDFVRRGRLRGLGCTLVTQRPAVLNKDVLTQAEVLITMGMTGPRDVHAINEWVQLHADEEKAQKVRATLASLPVGTAWVWSPEWLDILQKVAIRQRNTFDSSATPKVGQQVVVPQKQAVIDLAALGAEILATAEKKKADDPRELKRTVSRLQRELEAALSAVPAAPEPAPIPEPEIIRVPAISDGIVEKLSSISGQLATVAAELIEAIRTVTEAPTVAAPKERTPVMPVRRAVAQPVPDSAKRQMSTPARTDDADPSDIHLRSGARRMVDALGRMAPLRLTKSQWGTVAHLKTSGGTWGQYLGDIRRAGLLDENSIGYTLTPAGFDYIGGQPQPMTAGELQDHYRQILRAGASKMLDVLITSYPRGLTREELSDAAELTVTGGTFGQYLGDLTRNGLAEKRGGELFATEILMYGSQAQQ